MGRQITAARKVRRSLTAGLNAAGFGSGLRGGDKSLLGPGKNPDGCHFIENPPTGLSSVTNMNLVVSQDFLTVPAFLQQFFETGQGAGNGIISHTISDAGISRTAKGSAGNDEDIFVFSQMAKFDIIVQGSFDE